MYDQPDTTPSLDHTPLSNRPDDGWRPLADVCRELGVPSRRGARGAQAQQNAGVADKRRRAGGGSPQWWLSPAGGKALRLAMLGEAAMIAENRRLVTRLYRSGIRLLGRCFPR